MKRQADRDDTQSSADEAALQRWLNPRRKRFWAVTAILIYTVAGFFGVPALVKHLIVSSVRDDLGRTAVIESVRFNPYVLSLEIGGFRLDDPDGEALVAFDLLRVNFQLSSLFRWALTFREVRLDAPQLRVERYALDDSRFSRLLDDMAARAPAEEQEESDTDALPRFLVQDLQLNDGDIILIDHVPAERVEMDIGPASVEIRELNTLPDRHGEQRVRVQFPGDAVLEWQGSLDLAPFESAGQLQITNSQLEHTIAYLQAVLPLDKLQATLSLKMDYRARATANGDFDLELDGLDAELSDVAVSGLSPAAQFLVLPALNAYGGTFRYPEMQLGFSSVRLTEPGLNTWLGQDGRLNLEQLAPADAAEPTMDSAADGEPLRLAIGEFRIEDGRLGFRDGSIDPAAELELQGFDLTVQDISNDDGAVFPVSLSAQLSSGRIGFEGSIGALPGFSSSGTVRIEQLPLALAQPYVQQTLLLQVDDGALSSNSEFSLTPDGALRAEGTVLIAGLGVQDTRDEKPLVGWQLMDIDRYELDVAKRELKLSMLTFKEPYGRLLIREDLSTNLDGLSVDTPETTEPAAAEDDDPGWQIVIGASRIDDGSMDFSDLSLPLPFATRIQTLGGTISTVDSSSQEPSNVRLEGKVDEFGLARVEGTISLTDPVRNTDLSVEFRNLEMANLTPYLVEFAGRSIEAGKLDLDLLYRIENGQLLGQNDIVLSDFMLGEKVDNPDAIDLPLDLAVALLTDANGVIDIDLPVEGDVNDPEFAIGGVIWKAVAGLVTKVVTAPFRLLGNLIGVESEDLGQFQFLAGRADLTPPEQEQVLQLRQALQERPELAIEVAGAFAPAVDEPALQKIRLRSSIEERLGRAASGSGGDVEMLDSEIRDVLEALFTERFPAASLDELKAAHTAPPADKPDAEPVIDQLAYATALWERLLAGEEISAADLENLGQARAAAIRDAFLEGDAFDPGRVLLTGTREVESEDGEWVVTELAVATN